MLNYEIQNTDKFDILTYFLGTSRVVVLSPNCTSKSLICANVLGKNELVCIIFLLLNIFVFLVYD